MKRILFIMSVFLFLPVFVFSYYDVFTGYEAYYELIDDCESVIPSGGVNPWAPTSSTDATNIAVQAGKFGLGTNALRWDKDNTAYTSATTSIVGNNVYVIKRNITGLSGGYLQFWYLLPTLTTGAYGSITGAVSSTSPITNIGEKLTATRTDVAVQNGWNYFKEQLKVGPGDTAPVENSIISAKIAIVTAPSNITVLSSGILVDDIRVVSANNTTNGAWNEASGVWTVFIDPATMGKVYCQSENIVLSLPNIFTKTQYKDMVYTAKLKVKNPDADYCGLVFGYQSSNKNYYLFNLNHKAAGLGQLELKKFNGAVLSDVSTTPLTMAFASADDTYYWMRVVCKGTNVKTYISTDGITWPPVSIFNTTIADLKTGNIGLVAGKNGSGETYNRTVYFAELKVLSVPSSLTAFSDDGSVGLSWVPNAYSGEINSFNVYRSSTPTDPPTTMPTIIGTAAGANYRDNTVTNGLTYYYRVTANVKTGTTEEETDIALSTEVSCLPHPGIVVTNNPFTPTSSNPVFRSVVFTIFNPENLTLELSVFQPTGVLVNVISVTSGNTISWEGTNMKGSIVESGIYAYQVKVGGSTFGSGIVILAK